jgi:hypothetical protein
MGMGSPFSLAATTSGKLFCPAAIEYDVFIAYKIA